MKAGNLKKLVIGLATLAAVAVVLVEGFNCAYIIGEKVQVKIKVEEGQKKLDESNYTGAIENFRGAIKIDPLNIDAYWGVASAYIGLEDYDAAVDVLQNADKMISIIGEGIEAATCRNELKVRLEQIEAYKLSANS